MNGHFAIFLRENDFLANSGNIFYKPCKTMYSLAKLCKNLLEDLNDLARQHFRIYGWSQGSDGGK